MRTPTQQTINEALAYVAITGSKKFLHIDTRIAIEKYVTFNIQGPVTYTVNEEGMTLARSTKFWRAHAQIEAQGFRLRTDRKHRPSFVSYRHPEQVSTVEGWKTWQDAFTGWRGDVYVDEQNEKGFWVPTLQKLADPEVGTEQQPTFTKPRTSPAEVNKALKAAGFQDVTIIRGNGYYYFDDATTEITSIYSNSLFGFSTEEIVEHVRSELKRIKGDFVPPAKLADGTEYVDKAHMGARGGKESWLYTEVGNHARRRALLQSEIEKIGAAKETI